jgi:hypothetical protein
MVLFNKPVEEKEEHIEKNAPCVEKHADIENNLEKYYNNITIIYNANS